MSTVIERQSYRDYSIEQKAEVLALVRANGGNILATARQTGIPHQTIDFWVKNEHRFTELQECKTLSLVEKLDRSAHELVDALPGKIEDASLAQTATALGIVIDKKQILTNQPTQIIDVLNVESVSVLNLLVDALGDAIDVTPE